MNHNLKTDSKRCKVENKMKGDNIRYVVIRGQVVDVKRFAEDRT